MNTERLITILSLLKPHRRRLIGNLLLTLLLSVLAMLPPLVMRAIVDRVITPGDRSLLLLLGFFMLALPVISATCSFIQTLGMSFVGQHVIFSLRQSLYNHMLTLSMRFYSRTGVGLLVNRLMNDANTVQSVLTAQTIGVVSDFVCASFAITATFALNWRLALLLTLFVVAFVLNYRLNILSIRQANRGYQRSMDRLSADLQDRLLGNVAIKSYGTESREHESFQTQSEISLGHSKTMQYSGNTFSANTSLLAEGGRTLIFFLGCGLVLRDEMSYGDVMAFTAYAMQLLWPAVRFSMLARQIQDAKVAADRLFEILEEKSEVSDAPAAKPCQRLRGQVDFEHIAFHYDEGKPVIVDFNLHVEAGQTVALIGPTGCGKSTILSLLMRFFDVCDGSLKIDGMDLREIQLSTLRRQFGIVLQDPLLFTASIADNIRYARPGATQADIEAAARVAEIHDFIMTLPKGYQTVIGTEGVQLSVGQKQRITIARAVAADPAILIMDEATSSLDSESERSIQLAMSRVLRNRTAFIVAHRLSTIRNADVIVVMDKGRIAEKGRHEELLNTPGGHYAALYAKFMGKGVIEEDHP